MLHTFKAATHSEPPARLRTLAGTISASCGQLLPVSSSLPSSFARAAQRLVRVGREAPEGGSEGDRRAQGAGAASSIKRRQWMVTVVSMVTGHHSFAIAHRIRAWSKLAWEGDWGRSVDVEGDNVNCCDDIHSINIFPVHNAAMKRSVSGKPER